MVEEEAGGACQVRAVAEYDEGEEGELPRFPPPPPPSLPARSRFSPLTTAMSGQYQELYYSSTLNWVW